MSLASEIARKKGLLDRLKNDTNVAEAWFVVRSVAARAGLPMPATRAEAVRVLEDNVALLEGSLT